MKRYVSFADAYSNSSLQFDIPSVKHWFVLLLFFPSPLFSGFSLTSLKEQAMFPRAQLFEAHSFGFSKDFLFQVKPFRHCPYLHFHNGRVPGSRPKPPCALPAVELPLAGPLHALCAGSGCRLGKPHSFTMVNVERTARTIMYPFIGHEWQHTTVQRTLGTRSLLKATMQDSDTDTGKLNKSLL